MSNTDAEPRQSVSEAAPMPSNPLGEESRAVRESLKTSEVPANSVMEEPRAVRESVRNVATIEPPRAISVEEPPTPGETPESPRHQEQQRLAEVREFRNPHALPPNRITGPSFLGLSDESSDTSESSYLLDDDQPQRSHWRAWVAIAVLALLGFLIYKQWRAVKAGAMEVAQRATTSSSGNTTSPKPDDNVKGGETASNTPSPSVSSGASPSSKDLDKPESDKLDQSAASKEEGTSTPTDTSSAGASKDKDQSAQAQAKAKQSDEDQADEAQAKAKRSDDTARDETADDSAESKSAEHSKTKSAKKEEPAQEQESQFDNTAVDQADRYLRGEGRRQDCSRAISLLRSAAREGNPKAQVKLGALYATGHCVTQDRAAAYQWLARAQESQPNNSYLQRTMNNLWANMTPEERDRITR